MATASTTRRVAGWALRWATLYALWLALVDNAKVAELATGAVAAALAATAAELAEAGTVTRPRMQVAWMRRAYRPLLRMPLDTALLAVEAARRLVGRRSRGQLRAVRFRHRGGREAAGREVLAEPLGSLAPNRYVIGIDPEAEYLLVHELVPVDQPIDPLELG